ncbi:alpha/beta hydrolase family protein [Robertkochia aurantiaca]|uniref:alpha/beta hydrolase family protein n=1 Tax=Robertkochia aurantiaca TaxID=2873700 RepID=UPI001CCBA780|nr:S9 family peptidase [Robertkochia sp. 3YJGBD-33]
MRHTIILLYLGLFCLNVTAQQQTNFDYLDVFKLEYASDPQIAPDGEHIVYVRNGFDIMKDRRQGTLWLLDTDSGTQLKLTEGQNWESSPAWSPEGDRIAYISSTDEGAELFIYWVDAGRSARISQLPESPSHLTWSPDGSHIAFSMMVDEKAPVIAGMPEKPEGAKWAGTPRITDRLKHEADGRGYLQPGYRQLFVIPAIGGSARQLTRGERNFSGPLSWSPDGRSIYFSANLNEDWEYDFVNSEIYRLDVQTGETTALTDRKGPAESPVVSPDGSMIAFTGFEDRVQTYQVSELYLMNLESGEIRSLTGDLDRSIDQVNWAANGKGLYFTYDDFGNSKVGYTDLKGSTEVIADNLGGTSIGRPYPGGSYSVNEEGEIAFTYTDPHHPAEVAFTSGKGKIKILTGLNDDILSHRKLGEVEEVRYTSSVDGRELQGWIVKPPHYEEGKSYPLIVENHGGPILNYGDRFSAEMQLYASEGYLVFYPNPRGSTSYGEEFGNLLYNNYPGDDYQDVMDGVDHLIGKGYTSEDQLFVTGGSAGGIMTAWIIGKNNRFEAAVVAKPVMNWISKTLVADNYYGYANYRYPGQPWENVETYWKFSPISLVGNIETPTMVMVGMEDLRTPPSEAKQLYHALKIRKKETVLVEIPEASHGIASRPSNLITKIKHTVAWFEKYKK